MINNAFLQARVGSSRLPRKVLKDISGKPMLLHQIDRLKKSKNIDEIVVLTSLDESDDEILMLCVDNGIQCFRGDLDDVLSRFVGALTEFPCDNVIRVTGDCPLLDWELVDFVVNKHIEKGVDYTSNTIEPTFPDGLDIEVIKKEALLDACSKVKEKYEKEHVTYFIYNNPDVYSIYNVTNPLGDESHMRWTVDEPADFQFINAIYSELYFDKPFSTNEVRTLLKNKPEISHMNSGIERNMGLIKSLKESN